MLFLCIKRFTKPKRRKLSTEEVFHLMSQQNKVDMVELDTPGYEWEILGMMLNSGVITVWISILSLIYQDLFVLNNKP